MTETLPAPIETPTHPKGTLPAFTPVPRKAERSNGWKPAIQRQFIEALADTGSVKAACRRVGRAEVGVYLLRRHPEAASFRAAWEAALDLGIQRIEDVAMDRALNGVEVPVYSYGKLVGSRTVYNDRLLMFMLRNRAPERFADGRSKGMNAIGKMELERKKKQWREEWEAEKKHFSVQEVRASIARKFDKLRQDVAAEEAAAEDALSEETREAIDRAEQLKARDLARAGLGEEPELEVMKALPPFPTPEPPREEEPGEETGPRVRRLKDDGWG